MSNQQSNKDKKIQEAQEQIQANKQTQQQQQQQQSGTDKIKKNVQSQQSDNDYKENLKTLKRIVAQASPIIENKENSKVIKDANGNEVDQSVNEKVTTGYNYYAVDGKPIEEWIQEKFGGKVTLNKETRELKINDE
jgi:hypothetical protein